MYSGENLWCGVDFALPADHRIKLKEFEKKYKYLENLWNMQVTIISIVIGAFGTVSKVLSKGVEDLEVGGRVETIQTTTLLRTTEMLRSVLETWGYLLSINLQWKTISWCEKLWWVNNDNNNNNDRNNNDNNDNNVPADYGMKRRERQKLFKSVDLARKLTKNCTVILVVLRVLGTVTGD